MKQELEAWKDKRFGMFVHYGLYSVLGKGEWVMFQQPMDVEEYRGLADQFQPVAGAAEHWVQTAKEAGMKYMVVTSRHHDGFSLFDSPASEGAFTSVKSAAGRDMIREYTDACRAAGLGVGIYYSPMDWRFPGYFLPRMYTDSARRMREQCHNQVKELLTNYGKVDLLWFDGGEDYWLCHGSDLHRIADVRPPEFRSNPQIENFWQADRLNESIRTLQPGIVVNNRTGQRQYGDFLTPEGQVGEMNTETPWETCNTINGFWGWKPGGLMLSLRELVSLLVRVVTGDGNLLLNVGPRPDGRIEPEQVKRLREMGAWLNRFGKSIYKTRGGPFANGLWGGFTWRENQLFVHVIEWKHEYIRVPKANCAIVRIASMNDIEVIWREENGELRLSVPEAARGELDVVIVVEYEAVIPKAFSDMDCERFKQGEQLVSDAVIVEEQ